MLVREKGYYSWDGELSASGPRWLPIFLTGIKSVFRKRFAKLLFAICGSPFVVFALAVYGSTRPEIKAFAHMFGGLAKKLTSDAAIFDLYYSNPFLVFMIVMLSLFAGAELISADLRYKSMSLYLSRPITRWDYIVGKFAIVLFYVLLFTLVPGMLLVLEKIVLTGEFTIPISVIFAAMIVPAVVSVFLASLVFMFSAITTNGKMVKILFFIFYVVSNMVAGGFRGALHNEHYLYISIDHNIRQFSSFLFGTEPVFDAPGWLSGVILLGLTGMFFLVVKRRIGKAEV